MWLAHHHTAAVCTCVLLMQKRYARPLRDAIALLRVPRAEVALKPEEAWRPLQRILDAMHAQIR